MHANTRSIHTYIHTYIHKVAATVNPRTESCLARIHTRTYTYIRRDSSNRELSHRTIITTSTVDRNTITTKHTTVPYGATYTNLHGTGNSTPYGTVTDSFDSTISSIMPHPTPRSGDMFAQQRTPDSERRQAVYPHNNHAVYLDQSSRSPKTPTISSPHSSKSTSDSAHRKNTKSTGRGDVIRGLNYLHTESPENSHEKGGKMAGMARKSLARQMEKKHSPSSAVVDVRRKCDTWGSVR
jgi:hypothetical protein